MTRDGGKRISVQTTEDLKQATGRGFCLQLKSAQTRGNVCYMQKLHLREGSSVKEHEAAPPKKKNRINRTSVALMKKHNKEN